MVQTKHCSECNKDYLECENCHKKFRTNVRTCPEVTGHVCLEQEDKRSTAEAAAAGAAGGIAAGTAGGLAVTAGAPAALGAVGFTSSGVAGGSIAATLQGLLYAGATPAGGWFATCTSAAMGGAMGAAAVTAVAATGGVAVAAGAGYGIYNMVKKKKKNACPWCNVGGGGGGDSGGGGGGNGGGAAVKKGLGGSTKDETKFTNKASDVEKQPVEYSEDNEQAMFERAVALSLESFKEEKKAREETTSSEDTLAEALDAKAEFECPVCADVMSPPNRIWQCGEGHILCQDCRNHPDIKTCPSCRGQFVGRNLPMERMAAIVFK